MPYADHREIRIHYEVEGAGPPLVLQHGFTGNLKRWALYGYVEALRRHYRLILVDARGHGTSDKPHDPAAYDLPVLAGDIVAVLDALDLDTAHYWGYSMGGWIGFGMAKYAPQRLRSLIIGGAHPYAERLPDYTRLDGSDPEAFLAALFKRLGMNPATIPAALRADMLANDFRALTALQRDRPSLEEILQSIAIPCCLYVGEADPRFPKVQDCAQLVPGSHFFSLPGLDHGTAFRESSHALPQVTAFLQSAIVGTARPSG
jgi:pimeloyl-ACP methyl ester carboxylesterase